MVPPAKAPCRRFGALTRERQPHSAGAFQVGRCGGIVRQSRFQHGEVFAFGCGVALQRRRAPDQLCATPQEGLGAKPERAAARSELQWTPCRQRNRRGVDTSPSMTSQESAQRAPCEGRHPQPQLPLGTRAAPDDGADARACVLHRQQIAVLPQRSARWPHRRSSGATPRVLQSALRTRQRRDPRCAPLRFQRRSLHRRCRRPPPGAHARLQRMRASRARPLNTSTRRPA